MGANKENKINVKNIIKESAVVLVLVAIIIVFSFLSPQFFKVSNFITILRQISILAIVSVGMTVVLISGGIDLSVGSIISVVSVLTAMSAVYGKMPTGVAIVIGLLLGTFMGLINGVMITMTGMPPMIGTLATQMIFRGLGFIVCDGASSEWIQNFWSGLCRSGSSSGTDYGNYSCDICIYTRKNLYRKIFLCSRF